MQVNEWILGRALVATYMESGRASHRWVEAEGGWSSGTVMGTRSHRVPAEAEGRVRTAFLTRLWDQKVYHAFLPRWK